MTAPPPLVYPSSRILAGWWRLLAEHRPEALWVGQLLLHHVEALVGRSMTRRPAPADLLVLRALSLVSAASTADLDRHLHVGPQLVKQVLQTLKSVGLVADAKGWTLTEQGRQALERGEFAASVNERRSFYFLAGASPRYLPLRPLATGPWPAGDDWTFALSVLAAWFDQPAEQKRRHGFPLDLERLITPAAAADAAPAWQRVVFDRPERLTAVLLPRAAGLAAFAFRPDGWQLLTAEPVLELGDHWPEVFPEMAGPASPADVQDAWRQWCQARNIGGSSSEVGDLHLEGHYLNVGAAPKLLERLRAGRGEALREESWVLVGAGPLRRAVIVKVGEAR